MFVGRGWGRCAVMLVETVRLVDRKMAGIPISPYRDL